MAEPTKRKNFSEAEDVMHLKQTIADEPYLQEHGKVMEQWEKLAEALVACPDVSRKNLSGKIAQNRVNALIEKDELVDELILRMDEMKAEKAAKKKAREEKNAASESVGETIRRIAVERLKWTREADGGSDESPGRTNKFAKLAEILQSQREQELTMRREQWEQERHDRRNLEQRFMLLLEHLANKK
ncbi:hypothetical protein PF005_g28217 [Phytophthora fragariae]|uniref:Uncharacterized protein n=2 Tax=Phytophthora fragariae TaxID=53985 RepID=A0A6A3DMG9_9STRA|nr:hypothetical protein PF009_g28756 [Phytophthora fragariae]KAE9066613.1 hypothetical protein PF010_g27788 [Phytophthora fragariae]KAE9168825.1 hypothetical protein PF005_g28217 [Phytophthora fragariae]KAE9172479.1 hypothetical protein PF004_g27255 [Phytophthora fragariae]KAE9175313.1 hypothetical protein PF002_g28822 [Phytophthora fragariae]